MNVLSHAAVRKYVGLFLLLAAFSTLSAQGQSDIDPDQQTVSHFKAPVNVDGYELFSVRGISSFPAEARARTIVTRIKKTASNRSFPVDSLKKVLQTDRIQIFAGPLLIVNVYNEDAEVENISKDVMAELAMAQIRESIIRYRNERTAAYLKTHLLKAFIALGILFVSVFIFIRIFKRLNAWFQNRIKARIDNLENVSFKIIQSKQLLGIFQFLYQLVRMIIIIFITVFFVNYILGLFPTTRQVSKDIFNVLVNPLETFGVGFVKMLPSLVFLFILFLFTNYIIKLVRLLFHGIDLGEIKIKDFDPEWAMPTFKIVKLLIIIFALVIAYPYIPGSDSSAFQGISVFLGVLFSLGSSSFIANIIAGYSMTYRRAFKKGDRIQVNEFMGFVLDQSLMVTRLRSIKNEEIVIPNSVLLNSSIKNYTQAAKDRGIILHTTVGIGYETSWRLVEAMLKEAASRTEGLLKEPPAWVFQQSLNDFAVTYEINAYCQDPEKMYFIYTDLHRNILDVFNENNVQIMTPAYEGDPSELKVVPLDQWNTSLAAKASQHLPVDEKPPA
jgi:small-conductance mechanosensitive channel